MDGTTLRGGGGNFGVVTSFEYQLHPVKDIFAGIFFYPIERTRDVLEFYRDYVAQAPEQMGLFPAFQIAPPLPFIPEKEVGKTFCAIVSCWAGPLDEGEKALEPIRKAAPRSPRWSAQCRIPRSTLRSTRSCPPVCSTTGRRRSSRRS